MHTYKIRPGGFKEVRKQMLFRGIPTMLIAATAGIYLSTINLKPGETINTALPLIIPLIVIALGFGLYRGTKRLKASFDSYTLTVTNNLITREQFNTPTISIYFNEMKKN